MGSYCFVNGTFSKGDVGLLNDQKNSVLILLKCTDLNCVFKFV